jgi:signal transduction histidine kinase
LEKALIHAELVRVDELKRSFAAIAAHELRTPATSVHGVARTLRYRALTSTTTRSRR